MSDEKWTNILDEIGVKFLWTKTKDKIAKVDNDLSVAKAKINNNAKEINTLKTTTNNQQTLIDDNTKDITAITNLVTNNSNSISEINQTLTNKADKTTVDSLSELVNANTTELSNKASIDYVDTEISNINAIDSDNVKAEINTQIQALNLNSTYATKTELNNKADKDTVNSLSELVNSNITNLNNKAEISYVNEELTKKANNSDLNNYVTTSTANSIYATKTELDNKADKNTVTGLSNTVSEHTLALDTKADKTTVDSLRNSVSSNTANIATVGNTVSTALETINTHEKDIESLTEQVSPIIPLSQMEIHFPYRGIEDSGDCAIIKIPTNDGNKIVVIDLGPHYSINGLVSYCKDTDRNLYPFDYILVSHFHEDHVGGYYTWNSGSTAISSHNVDGLYTLFDEDIITTKTQFYFPHNGIDWSRGKISGAKDDFKGPELIKQDIETFISTKGLPTAFYPSEDDELIIGEATFKFMNLESIYYEAYYNEDTGSGLDNKGYPIYNNFSMIEELTYGDKIFSFMGDIQEKAQELLWSKLQSPDLLKVEHHAFDFRANENYLGKMSPQYAIICNFATEDCFDWDKQMRRAAYMALDNVAEIYQTNYSGNIVVTTDGRTLNIVSENGRQNIDGATQLNAAKGLPDTVTSDSDYFTDIDKIFTPGTYFCQSTVQCERVENYPLDNGPFKLIVEYLAPGSSQTIRQTIIRSYTENGYILTRLYHTSKGWYPWTSMTPFAEGIILRTITEGETETHPDLNKCDKECGYSCWNEASNALTSNVVNTPTGLGNRGFKVLNHHTSSSTLIQLLYPNYSSELENGIYMRSRVDGSWKPWFFIKGTQV